MNYVVRPGQESVFEAACQRVLELMDETDGHAESRLYRRVDGAADHEYLIVSRWSEEATFERFVRSEAFRKVTSWGLEHVLEARPRHTTYREG